MSYRKAKLLLEQKRLQQQQQKNIQQNQQQSDQQPVIKNKKPNLFQGFGGDSSQQQQVKVQTKKQVQKPQKTNKNKKKNKKKNNKDKKQQLQDQKQLDQKQVQKIFKQVGLQYKKNIQIKQQVKQDWFKILQINQNKFNYQKQLKRHFGGVGNLAQDRNDQPQMDKRQQKIQKHLKKTMKKSVLAPGVKDFFLIRQKFQVNRQQDKIKFSPTTKYQHYQVQYQAVRNSNDVNLLINFMQMHPQHVDSIYAVGQFIRLQGNYRDADNLIQRVIYIYQMAASYDLGQFIKQDFIKKQISYQKYSIALFMSLFKFMDILGKKGCFRAALQYNKYLLKININDPTACMLCLDYNSISSKSYDYLLKFIKGYGQYIGCKDKSLYLLPNFAFSAALAKYYVQNPQKPQKQLVVQQNNTEQLLNFTQQNWQKAIKLPQQVDFSKQSAKTLILRAILLYPKLIIQIANKNQYAKQFVNFSKLVGNQKKSLKDILAHQFWTMIPISYSYNFLRLQSQLDSIGLDKVMQVYVQRSKILWKSNPIILWVKAALGFILNKIDDNKFDYQQYLQGLIMQQANGLHIPFNLNRYSNISKANFSDRVDRIDLANIQDNQQMQQPINQNRMNLQQGNPLTMFLNSLLPWVNLPNAQNNQNQDPDMPDIMEDD